MQESNNLLLVSLRSPSWSSCAWGRSLMSVQLCAQRGEDLLLLWLGLSSRWRTYLPVTCAFTRRSGRRGAVMPLRSPQCAQITCTNAPLISLFCMREDLGYAWRQPNKMFFVFYTLDRTQSKCLKHDAQAVKLLTCLLTILIKDIRQLFCYQWQQITELTRWSLLQA